MKPFGGFASASSKPRSASNSQEPSTSSSSAKAKANGAISDVHVSADSRVLIALCGRTLADKETAGVTVIPERMDETPPSAKGRMKDEELYPLTEFRTWQDTETMLVIRDEFRVEDNGRKLLARCVQVCRICCSSRMRGRCLT